MHIAFLNPQGNFDRADSYWTEHPDFGGQLVYVKNVAMALAALGHQVDIVTRQVVDDEWPEFADADDAYDGVDGVRIVRIPCGPPEFLRKEDLWDHLSEWVDNLIEFYNGELPDAATGHYGDGGLAAALLQARGSVPYTFTGHSLGAQKLDKLAAGGTSLAELDSHYFFRRRLSAERIAMAHAGTVITSTNQERFDQYGHHSYRGAIDPNDDSRFRVVPPGVALDVFGADQRSANEEEAANQVETSLAAQLDPTRLARPVVVASSRLDPKKNLLALVEAFGSSADLRERANLVMFTGALPAPLQDRTGAGSTESAVLDEIQGVIDSQGLQGLVAAFGLQGQPALAAAYRHLVRRRSVFALTALYEPFGLAPLEAAAAGLPVVVTRNGGPSESLTDEDGDYGVLVDPTDPQDIASGLLKALGPEWEVLAAAGRQRVLDRYTWDRTALGYIDAINAARGHQPPYPIHPYFTGSGPDVSLEELQDLYRGGHDAS